MIYGDIPAFDAVVESFQSFADKLLMGGKAGIEQLHSVLWRVTPETGCR